MELKQVAKLSGLETRPIEFSAAGFAAVSLTFEDAPRLQRLLEQCSDYYALVEGRPPEPDAAIGEMTDGPPERVPHDLVCLGIHDDCGSLAGVVGALRNHRRPNQWYLGLMLLDPVFRGRGLGASIYRGFEGWVAAQGAESILLAVVTANVRAARFWESCGFGWPRSYPERTIGLRRHVLIEYEKALRPLP
jgi:GNAT superfamily N-acetyltransferase